MGLFTKRKTTFGTILEGADKNGKVRIIEPPSTKSNRYKSEREKGLDAKTGKVLSLADIKYREGYNRSQADNARIYKCTQKKSKKDE